MDRSAPRISLNDIMLLGLAASMLSGSYNLYIGQHFAHRPLSLNEVLVWMLLCGWATLVSFVSIPLLALAQRRGLMRDAGWKSWGAFLLLILLCSLAGSLCRLALWPLFLPELLTPGRAVGLTINQTWSLVILQLITAWFLLQRRRFAEDAEHRDQFARELVVEQQQLVHNEDRLRRQLAEYIHGPVQTQLLLAWIRLKEAHLGSAALPEASREAARILRASRAVDIEHLRSSLEPGAAAGSAEAAITRLSDRFRQVIPIESDWSREARELAAHLAPEAQIMLVQLVEECFLNALRHAAPRRIRLSAATQGADTLRLCIQDDGRGFRPGALSPGLGFKMVDQKLKEIGGAWNVHSATRGGTAVTLDFLVAP